jgi:hypothetical protein
MMRFTNRKSLTMTAEIFKDEFIFLGFFHGFAVLFQLCHRMLFPCHIHGQNKLLSGFFPFFSR